MRTCRRVGESAVDGRPASVPGVSRKVTMGACQPYLGIRSYVLHHPPLVVFCLCIVTLAASFLSLGVYIQTRPVRDTNFDQDWDTVLSALGSNKICPQNNVTASSPEPTGGLLGDSAGRPEDLGSAFILAGIALSPWDLAINHTRLRISARGSHLGMRGPSADAHLTVTVTSSRWSVQCNNSDAECSVKYCLTVIGPQSLLPPNRSSAQCPMSNSSHRLLRDLYVVGGGADTAECYSLVYNEDSDLKTMMSQKDRSLCSERLIYTSVSLLGLGAILCVASAFCALPVKDKRIHGPL